jgi:hypothetical protein
MPERLSRLWLRKLGSRIEVSRTEQLWRAGADTVSVWSPPTGHTPDPCESLSPVPSDVGHSIGPRRTGFRC